MRPCSLRDQFRGSLCLIHVLEIHRHGKGLYIVSLFAVMVIIVPLVQAGDASAEELASVTQLTGAVIPIVKPRPTAEIVSITDEMKAQKGYYKLRQERMNERLVGIRKKKAEAAEKEDKK